MNTKKQNSTGVDRRIHRLLELNQQMNILCRKQERMIQSLLPDAGPELPELSFDDHRRRIYWPGGSVKLGKKSYRFVKTIWLGEDHRAEFVELEEAVWLREPKTKTFVTRRTVSTLAQYAEKNLTEANFPYRIEVVKNFFSREIEGFSLVPDDRQKKNCPSEREGEV